MSVEGYHLFHAERCRAAGTEAALPSTTPARARSNTLLGVTRLQNFGTARESSLQSTQIKVVHLAGAADDPLSYHSVLTDIALDYSLFQEKRVLRVDSHLSYPSCRPGKAI